MVMSPARAVVNRSVDALDGWRFGANSTVVRGPGETGTDMTSEFLLALLHRGRSGPAVRPTGSIVIGLSSYDPETDDVHRGQPSAWRCRPPGGEQELGERQHLLVGLELALESSGVQPGVYGIAIFGRLRVVVGTVADEDLRRHVPRGFAPQLCL